MTKLYEDNAGGLTLVTDEGSGYGVVSGLEHIYDGLRADGFSDMVSYGIDWDYTDAGSKELDCHFAGEINEADFGTLIAQYDKDAKEAEVYLDKLGEAGKLFFNINFE